jgi:hypothetical protein
MHYKSGEVPVIGDRVKNKDGRRATVIDLKGSLIEIKWDEGVVGLEYSSEQFALVERGEQKSNRK